MCNAKKNADNEVRTGYGGGFMDRQQVEYKEKVGDSDNEYDEFGRKKRKGTSNGDKSDYKKPRIEDDEEEEEEEEEGNLDKYKLFSEEEEEDDDGDDEDLAKYDLTADPEVVEKKDEVISKFERPRSPESSE